MTQMPSTYEAYRQALRALVNEAWPFYGLTQVYRSSIYEPETNTVKEIGMTVKKNRRSVLFGADDAIADPFRDAWDYFQAERLLTADARWCDAFARKLDTLR